MMSVAEIMGPPVGKSSLPYCIFCFREVCNTGWSSPLQNKSNKYKLLPIARFLGIQFRSSSNGSVFSFRFCPDCDLLLDKFAEQYGALRRIEMELEWKVGMIRDIMEVADRVPSRLAFVRGYYYSEKRGQVDSESELKQVEEWRRKFVKKCVTKKSASVPQVKLHQLANTTTTNILKRRETDVETKAGTSPPPVKNGFGDDLSIMDTMDDISEDEIWGAPPVALPQTHHHPPSQHLPELSIEKNNNKETTTTTTTPFCGTETVDPPSRSAEEVADKRNLSVAQQVRQEEDMSLEILFKSEFGDKIELRSSRLLRAQFRCHRCTKTFSSQDRFNSHQETHHHLQTDVIVNNEPEELSSADESAEEHHSGHSDELDDALDSSESGGEEHDDDDESWSGDDEGPSSPVYSDTELATLDDDSDDTSSDAPEPDLLLSSHSEYQNGGVSKSGFDSETKQDCQDVGDEDNINSPSNPASDNQTTNAPPADDGGPTKLVLLVKTKELVVTKSPKRRTDDDDGINPQNAKGNLDKQNPTCSICRLQMHFFSKSRPCTHSRFHQDNNNVDSTQIQTCGEVGCPCSVYFLSPAQLQPLTVVHTRKRELSQRDDQGAAGGDCLPADSSAKNVLPQIPRPDLKILLPKKEPLKVVRKKRDGQGREEEGERDETLGDGPDTTIVAPLKSLTKFGDERWCSICLLELADRKSYKSHYATHHDLSKVEHPDSVLRCGQGGCCEAYFLLQSQLRDHLFRAHDGLSLDNNSKRTKFDCSACHQSFTHSSSRSKHFAICHDRSKLENPDDVLACDQPNCTAYFLLRRQLNWHRGDAHGKWHDCSICGKELRSRASLKKHRSSVHKDELQLKFPCGVDGCGKSFECDGDLQLHTKFRHNGKVNKLRLDDPLLSCPKCGKVCRGKRGITAHMASHLVERTAKPHVCEQCGKAFQHQAQLDLHYKAHAGQDSWEFQCSSCGKKCLTKEKLEEHSRTHTGEKPYTCQHCGVSYAHKHNLRIHVNSKHPEAPDLPRRMDKTNLSSRKGVKIKK